jgi:hypothetical protein
MFEELSPRLFEMGFDKRVVKLMQRAGKLFAVATSPLLATNEAADPPAREMDFASDRSAVVGMFLDQRNENLVCERAGCPSFESGRIVMCFSITPALSSISAVRFPATFWS